ncbi:MAG: hypothetical protein ABIH23_05125 [bacterium]
MDEKLIKTRVDIRRSAVALVELILEEVRRIPDADGDTRGVFWDEIRKVLPRISRQERVRLESEVMTDQEARVFGNERMPFGEFKGMRIDDIELSRLTWYADQTFQKQLRRYLKSSRLRSEIEQGD